MSSAPPGGSGGVFLLAGAEAVVAGGGFGAEAGCDADATVLVKSHAPGRMTANSLRHMTTPPRWLIIARHASSAASTLANGMRSGRGRGICASVTPKPHSHPF